MVVLVRGCTAWRPEPRSIQSQDIDKHMGFPFPREVLKQWRKEPESETSHGHNCTVALGLSMGLAVLDGECYLVMPLHAVSMHHVELKILMGFLTRQLCQISCHTNVSTALLKWKLWKEVLVYADLKHVLSPLFYSGGLVQAWGETILKHKLRQFEVLEHFTLKRVSHGSASSAFESSAQFGSVLILAQVLHHCHVNSVYQFLRQRSVLQDFCTLVLKYPSTAWASQNRKFLIFFYHRQFGYWA